MSENLESKLCFKTYLIVGKMNEFGAIEKFPYVDEKELHQPKLNKKTIENEWDGFFLI
jgi:hypothetical protein